MNVERLTLILILSSFFGLNVKAQSNTIIIYSSDSNSYGRDIYRLNSDGSNKTKLSKESGNGHYPHHINPKLSPDGSKIVYQSDPDGHDRYTIWIMNSDGTNQKKITQNEGLFPNWSPSGKEIIFSGRRNGIWEIILIPIDGGSEEFVTRNKVNGMNRRSRIRFNHKLIEETQKTGELRPEAYQ